METAFKNPEMKPGTIGDLLEYELTPEDRKWTQLITRKLVSSATGGEPKYGLADALYDIATGAPDGDAAIMQTFLITIMLAKMGASFAESR